MERLKEEDLSLVIRAFQAWKTMQPDYPPKGVIYEGDKAYVILHLDGERHKVGHKVNVALLRDRNDRAIPPHLIPDVMLKASGAHIEWKAGKISRITFSDYPERDRKEWRKLQGSYIFRNTIFIYKPEPA
jgi:hypothetical protein